MAWIEIDSSSQLKPDFKWLLPIKNIYSQKEKQRIIDLISVKLIDSLPQRKISSYTLWTNELHLSPSLKFKRLVHSVHFDWNLSQNCERKIVNVPQICEIIWNLSAKMFQNRKLPRFFWKWEMNGEKELNQSTHRMIHFRVISFVAFIQIRCTTRYLHIFPMTPRFSPSISTMLFGFIKFTARILLIHAHE